MASAAGNDILDSAGAGQHQSAITGKVSESLGDPPIPYSSEEFCRDVRAMTQTHLRFWYVREPELFRTPHEWQDTSVPELLPQHQFAFEVDSRLPK